MSQSVGVLIGISRKRIHQTDAASRRCNHLPGLRGVLQDKHIAAAEDEFHLYIDQVVAADPSTDLGRDERVWDMVELQLIGLFMNSELVVYDKHLMVNENGERPKTRELDDFETESLVNLRAGAERVIAWDKEDNCLRVLGAIRTKEACQKCHEAKIGLLGAFSYRIKEVTSR